MMINVLLLYIYENLLHYLKEVLIDHHNKDIGDALENLGYISGPN